MSPLNFDLHIRRWSNGTTAAEPGGKTPVNPAPDIIDIRRGKISLSLKEDIISGLGKPAGEEKTLPTMLLYSAEGLKIFEEITYLPEYYLTNTEISILEKSAASIAERLPDGGIVVELGSGNLRKILILLRALEHVRKRTDYYALDLSPSELKRTLSMLGSETFEYVRFHGLHGTYDDGREWLRNTPDVRDRPRCIVSLGSSLGNFDAAEAAEFLKGWAEDVLRPGKEDSMLLGMDGCKDPDRVWTAYNDPHGATERFIMSGLKQANEIFGAEVFCEEEWEYLGEWNAEVGRHQAYFVPKVDVAFQGELEGVVVKRGEKVNIEYSYKFDGTDAEELWEKTGLEPGARWTSDDGDYALHLVSKKPFMFGLRPEEYAAHHVPSLTEWEELWKAWDTVTLGMIPEHELLSKPIDLRNPCVFYLGHIPTFLDSLLVQGGGFEPIEPMYRDIFQRGIDPDVDDPTQCHKHSSIPQSWPALGEILEYTKNVRDRIRGILKREVEAPLLRRAIWTGFEHEAMHLETLLYMLVQSDSTLPPPGVIRPDFSSERRKDSGKIAWHKIPDTTITVGIDDPEDPELTNPHHFGWDNEKPARPPTTVQAFSARNPITNSEYATFLHDTSSTTLPASWVSAATPSKGFDAFIASTTVRTVFGLVPLAHALDWPATASYDELSACAAYLGGSIPTADQVRAIYAYVDAGKQTEKKLSGKFSAVNGHLVNNGVCETPPSTATRLFADLSSANVAFRHWHPTSVRSERLLGRGETGGVWEWTGSVLERDEGFEKGALYPEYTDDFFDDKHNVVLGGSWASHSRIAGRGSFVNWYRRNYRFVWAGARVVREE